MALIKSITWVSCSWFILEIIIRICQIAASRFFASSTQSEDFGNEMHTEIVHLSNIHVVENEAENTKTFPISNAFTKILVFLSSMLTMSALIIAIVLSLNLVSIGTLQLQPEEISTPYRKSLTFYAFRGLVYETKYDDFTDNYMQTSTKSKKPWRILVDYNYFEDEDSFDDEFRKVMSSMQKTSKKVWVMWIIAIAFCSCSILLTLFYIYLKKDLSRILLSSSILVAKLVAFALLLAAVLILSSKVKNIAHGQSLCITKEKSGNLTFQQEMQHKVVSDIITDIKKRLRRSMTKGATQMTLDLLSAPTFGIIAWPGVKPVAATGIKGYLDKMWKAVDPKFTELVEEILKLLGISKEDFAGDENSNVDVEANIPLTMKLAWVIIILFAIDVALSLLTLVLMIPKAKQYFEQLVIRFIAWWKQLDCWSSLNSKVRSMCSKKKKKEKKEKEIRAYNPRHVKQHKKDVEDIYYF